MTKAPNTLNLIATDALQSNAQAVVDITKRNTPFPYLIDAKLGSAENVPMHDAVTAERNNTPFYTIAVKWKDVVQELIKNDAQRGNPLYQIAQRANDIIARAAILNRHNRRPPLYSETTIEEFIKMGLSTPQHSPLIRAAGHVTPPPVFSLGHDLSPIVPDIAAHVSASHEPQSVGQVLQSLTHRQDLLSQWPQLDLTLFIQRMTGIRTDHLGLYSPDQPWGKFVSAQRLVASTILRILKRDQETRTTAQLVTEVERLVGQFLPAEYHLLAAVRAAISKSDAVTWQGRSTFGLRQWETTLGTHNMVVRHKTTGDLIYAFLMQHGPADVREIIKHVQQNSTAKKRTVQEAINHDAAKRFLRTPDGRVVINPIPKDLNPDAPSLKITPDGNRERLAPVLRQSELLWITLYVQALSELTPPWPARVTLTGPRAAGFPLDDPMKIVVVVDDHDKPNLEPRLAEIAVAASEAAPSVRPSISIASPQQWDHQLASEHPRAHYNVWLASGEAP